MSEKQIFQKIKTLADKLNELESFYTRADLAYELKDFGIENDSVRVSELVWKSYVYYDEDEKIRRVFVNNEKQKSLVDEYCICPMIDQGDVTRLSSKLDADLCESNNALSSLESAVSGALKDYAANGRNRLVGTIVGTKGTTDVQSEATSLFQNYTDMVNAYEMAKGEVKGIINDFINLRGYINEIFLRYSLALTDIFGDSIKSVSPELFDFDSIQWLDVRGMLQNVQLEYSQIMGRCGELIGVISENFSNSMKNAAVLYRGMENRRVGLMLAGIEMINHYLTAQQQTNELRGQLLTLKTNVKHDAALIKGDLGRLMVIYKGMHDLHVPRAEAFYRYSRELMESDLNRIMGAIYNSPELKELVGERQRLLKEYKMLETEIADSQVNIDYYTAHIAECETFVQSMGQSYEEAKSSKPSKPFFLLNIITLGASGKKYNREVSEWYLHCHPVIKQYEDLQVDISLDKDDLAIHQKKYKQGLQKLEKMKCNLKESGTKIMQRISVDRNTKTEIAGHLETLIKLLRVAKEIVSTGLDAKLTSVVAASDYRNEKLPAELTKNIYAFAQTLKDNMQVSKPYGSGLLSERDGQKATDDSEYNLQVVADAQNKTAENMAELFESWAILQQKKAEGRIIAKRYDAELERLRRNFRKDLANIDDKSAVLCEALKKLHASRDINELKEGLLALSGAKWNFTDKDWDDFFHGTKTIEI